MQARGHGDLPVQFLGHAHQAKGALDAAFSSQNRPALPDAACLTHGSQSEGDLVQLPWESYIMDVPTQDIRRTNLTENLTFPFMYLYRIFAGRILNR